MLLYKPTAMFSADIAPKTAWLREVGAESAAAVPSIASVVRRRDGVASTCVVSCVVASEQNGYEGRYGARETLTGAELLAHDLRTPRAAKVGKAK